MKKFVILFVLILFILSLIGCSEEPQKASDQISTVPTYIQEPTQSQTPKPTLSEEEKENINKFNELIDYCERYYDWSAAVLIKGMYYKGEITKKQYYELFSIDEFSEAKEFSDELWTKIKEHVKYLSDIINGNLNELSEEDLQKFYQDLNKAFQQGTIYINILDSQEKIDRVVVGISYINKWINDITEENFELVKETFESESLNPGEKTLLYCYICSNPEFSDKIDDLDIDEITEQFNSAYEELLSLNNS